MSVDVSAVTSDQPRSVSSPTSSSPATPSPPQGSSSSSLMKDIALWHQKQWSAGVLLGSTAIWTLLEVYKFNLLPLICWATMAFLTFLFLQGNLLRITQTPEEEEVMVEGENLAKSREDNKFISKKSSRLGSAGAWRLRRWEVTEEEMNRVTRGVIQQVEESIRWMLRIGAAQRTSRDWLTLGGLVSGLFLVGYFGRFFDFITMLYIGVIVGMTGPVTYMKNEKRIKEYGERARVQSKRVYDAFDERSFFYPAGPDNV